MVASTNFLTPQQLATLEYSTFDLIINKGKRPHVQDLPERPLMKLLGKKIELTQKPFIDNKVTYNVETLDDDVAQEAYGRTQLDFTEDNFGDSLVFDACQIFTNRDVVHDALEAMGYVTKAWSNFKQAPKLSEAQKLEIMDYLSVLFMRMEDSHDRNWDSALHGSGSGSYTLAGLAALFPTDNTTGTVGGKSRAANLWARHQSVTGLTATAGGTLQTGLDNLKRECMRYAKSGRIDAMLVGSDVLDAVKTYAKNNNLQLNANLSGTNGIDPSMPDSDLKWDGIPLIWDPTLDTLGTPKLGYMLNTSTLGVYYHVKKEFSRIPDEYNLRVSRYSIRSKFAMIVKQPNANGVFTVA